MLNASHIMMHNQQKLSRLLRKGIRKEIGFNGVSFVDSGGWVYQRLKLTFSQKEILRLQEDLDSDIASTLDYPISVMHNTRNDEITASVKNAILASRIRRSEKLLLFASVHGSDPIVIRNVIRHLKVKGNFDGFAIGSLRPSFYNFELLVDIIMAARRETPREPLHVYGLAGPVLAELLAYLGVDSMDSSFFIMAAANRMYATPTSLGRIPASKINDLKEWVCNCKICKKYDSTEIATSRWLLALHNLWIAWSQVNEFRQSLEEGIIEDHIRTRFVRRSWSKKAFEYAKHRKRFGSRSL